MWGGGGAYQPGPCFDSGGSPGVGTVCVCVGGGVGTDHSDQVAGLTIVVSLGGGNGGRRSGGDRTDQVSRLTMVELSGRVMRTSLCGHSPSSRCFPNLRKYSKAVMSMLPSACLKNHRHIELEMTTKQSYSLTHSYTQPANQSTDLSTTQSIHPSTNYTPFCISIASCPSIMRVCEDCISIRDTNWKERKKKSRIYTIIIIAIVLFIINKSVHNFNF